VSLWFINLKEDSVQEIKVAHSPDSDDAFMFYALANDKLDTGDLKFTHVLQDIESLNRRAFNRDFDVTAVSFHAYAYLADKYLLLPSGASMGERYGPMVIARQQMTVDELKDKLIAVPGTMTTAFLGLKLLAPDFRHEVVPFDKIIDAVSEGQVDAGLIIHEGQLTYQRALLHKVVDLGEWWCERTGLPLPLGGNVIRRDLPPDVIRRTSALLKASIQYALDHRQEALAYALSFARDMDEKTADKFVGMYVNELTLDYGEQGRAAVRRLLDEGHAAGVIPHKVDVEFVD
jgi:1,4-dihydroxy-6-naphthoate synthase